MTSPPPPPIFFVSVPSFLLSLSVFLLRSMPLRTSSESDLDWEQGQCARLMASKMFPSVADDYEEEEDEDEQKHRWWCHSERERFNVSRLARHNAAALAGFVGIWRSPDRGKAFFPTIPNFTYGEQLELGLANMRRPKRLGTLLEYRAVAWAMNPNSNQTTGELHSEYGFLVVSRRGRVALNTAMSNGFTTVEEGHMVDSTRLRLRSVHVSRVTWGHDFPVTRMLREWTLLDGGRRMESRLSMETDTAQGLREHTIAIYDRIYPID